MTKFFRRIPCCRFEWNHHSHDRSFAGPGLYREAAVDLSHALPHAEQAEPFPGSAGKLLVHFKGLAVVFDFNLKAVAEFAKTQGHVARVRVFDDVRETFLRHAIDHGLLVIVQVFGFGAGHEPDMQPRPLGKILQVGTQRREQAQFIEHRGAQLAGETVHRLHRLRQQHLRSGDFLFEHRAVHRAVALQHSQVGVEDGERLANLVMEFAADVLALLFLHMEELTGEFAQIAAQPSQFGVATLERLVDLTQLEIRSAKTAMRGFKRREGFREKGFRGSERASYLFRRVRAQQARRQRLLVDARYVQHAQAARDGLPANLVGLLEKGFLLPNQVAAQRGGILSGQPAHPTIHAEFQDNARPAQAHRRGL